MSYYDILLAKQLSGGGGGDITVESLSVTANGTYSAPSGKAYSPVVANVPNSYSASDEGKVVSSGALVAQTSQTIDTNGTYDTTLKNSVTVNVSGGGGGGIEYEAGAWTPTADTDQCAITFANAHSVPPSFVAVVGDINTLPSETTFGAFTYANIERMFGTPFYRTSTKKYYGSTVRYYRNTSSASGVSDSMTQTASDTSSSDTTVYDPRYWCNEYGICGKNGNGTDGLFKAGVTYNWVAIWYTKS